jgi:uncharacterized protein (DUF2237 family)
VLRDDSSNGGGRPSAARNVLGEPLEICSIKPMTGFYRDVCCNTGQEDVGSHTVCVVMTAAFLEFSKSRGNDLSTPMPEFGFAGLKPGDRWCLAQANGNLNLTSIFPFVLLFEHADHGKTFSNALNDLSRSAATSANA